jgi:hypothetical protein
MEMERLQHSGAWWFTSVIPATWENQDLKPAWTKSENLPPHPQHTSISSWSWWQVPVILLVGGLNKRISVQEGWPKNLRLFSKNNQSKKGWRCGSSGTLESPVLFFFGLVRQGLAVYLRLA